MIRIGVRELRQNASRYLDRVKAGEVVEVTERGQLIALLVAPTPAIAARDRLIASGRLLGARTTFESPPRRHTTSSALGAMGALREQRDERFS